MKVFYVIPSLLFVCFLATGLMVQIPCGEAAPLPLPQKIAGPQLQRDDCLTGESDSDDPFVSYIEEFTFTDPRAGISLYSCINWRGGFLKSEGIGKKGSRRAAELVARNNALKTLLIVNLNSTVNLQQYFTRKTQVSIKIRNVLIKNAELQDLPADPKTPDDARVIVTIPFYGISGLTSFFLDDQEIYLKPLTDTQFAPAEVPSKSGEYTGIIIDARGISGLEPALLPKIVSEDGEVVYEASQVSREILQTQGMIEYVREMPDKTAWRVGEHPLVVKPVLLASTAKTPSIFKNFGSLTRSFQHPLLAQTQTRTRRRGGNKLIIEATDDAGEIPVNAVVSVEDAKKIKQLNEQNGLDKQGNYTILIGGEIGGVKGQYIDGVLAMQYE